MSTPGRCDNGLAMLPVAFKYYIHGDRVICREPIMAGLMADIDVCLEELDLTHDTS